MSRKNRRNRREYRDRLGFNPDKYIRREAHSCGAGVAGTGAGSNTDRIDRVSDNSHNHTVDHAPERTADHAVNHTADHSLNHTADNVSDNVSDRAPDHVSRPLHNPSRGEVWFAQLGYHPGTSVQAGCRPVLVVSNDTGNHHATTIVVLPMTTSLKKSELPTHVELCQDDLTKADLNRPLADSMILAEQITTISKAALRNYIGKVEGFRKLNEIDNAVKVQLAI